MATAKAKILIGGTEYDPFSVKLEQRFDTHHYFSISVSAEKAEGDYSSSIDNSISSIGKEAKIQIKRPNGSELNFNGIITSIHINRTYTFDNLIVFEGVSPTFLTEDGKGTRSFSEKSLADIAREVIGAYPSNLMNMNVSPQYDSEIPYVVQYRETNYEFLQRLAALYGEWFFYDGSAVIFGKLPNPKSLNLTLGDDLSSFNFGVNIKPTTVKYQSYNYKGNSTVESSTKGFKPGWLDNYAKKGLDTADKIFPSELLDAVYQEAQDDAILKHLAEAQKSSILSDFSFFKGKSHHPGITVGARISVKALNRVGGSTQENFVGRYRVIAVNHFLDANKDYTNSFQAIPQSVTAPPVNIHVSRPEAETQVAVVKENNDPDQLGRIRVQHKWQINGEITPWIRIMTNHAFGDRGVYFVPEIGDEVLIGFEQANPNRPYMMGAHYHGSAKPEWADPDNNLKAIKTRSGHTILLDDKDGEESITILDKSGNTYIMDTKEKSITITAPENMTLNCKNMFINVEEDLKLQVGKNTSSTIGKDVNSTIGNNISTSVGDNMTTNIGDNVEIQIGGDCRKTVSFDYSLAAKNATLSSEKQMDCSAGTDFSVNSKNNSIIVQDQFKARSKDMEFNASKKFEVNASKEVRQEGGKMELISKGKMTLKGSATTYVQGAQVKIKG